MKTIQQMWEEYAKATGLDNPMDEMNPIIRKAFFAGFNRAYNIANSGIGLKLDDMGSMHFVIDEYENEMDRHSEEDS